MGGRPPSLPATATQAAPRLKSFVKIFPKSFQNRPQVIQRWCLGRVIGLAWLRSHQLCNRFADRVIWRAGLCEPILLEAMNSARGPRHLARGSCRAGAASRGTRAPRRIGNVFWVVLESSWRRLGGEKNQLIVVCDIHVLVVDP